MFDSHIVWSNFILVYLTDHQQFMLRSLDILYDIYLHVYQISCWQLDIELLSYIFLLSNLLALYLW